MIKLISDTKKIQNAFGFDPMTQLLAPGLHLDDPKMVTPLMIELDGQPKLVAREQETGNLQSLGMTNDKVIYYDHYVTLGGTSAQAHVYESLPVALTSVGGSNEVSVEAEMPYGRYLQLGTSLQVQVEGEIDATPVYVSKHAPADVLRRFAEYREIGDKAVRRLVETRKNLSPVLEMLGGYEDNRFEMIDEMLGDAGLDGTVVASPVNLRELTGLALEDGVFCLWSRGGDVVYVIAPTDDAFGGEPAGNFASLGEAVAQLSNKGNLGVDEGYLTVGQAQHLQGAGVTITPFTRMISKWREYRDVGEVSFSVLIAECSRRAIEGAIAYGEQELAAGREVTERQLYERYQQIIAEYQQELGEPFEITEFFVNCHAANRTIYPSQPVDWPITAESNSLKIDAGLILSIDGVVLGTSDMARTLTTSESARETYKILMKIVYDQIGEMREGLTGEEIHRQFVDKLVEAKPRFVELGTLSEDVDIRAAYGLRNTGHLMGKQESFTTEWRPNDTDTLRMGAVGTSELQWPYGTYSIGAEEMFVLGPSGAFGITIADD